MEILVIITLIFPWSNIKILFITHYSYIKGTKNEREIVLIAPCMKIKHTQKYQLEYKIPLPHSCKLTCVDVLDILRMKG